MRRRDLAGDGSVDAREPSGWSVGALPPRPVARRPVTTSVIVPVLDAAATVGEQLRALAVQDHPGPWELLLVDNGSTDATGAVVDAALASIPSPRWQSVRRLDAVAKAGSAYARNVGAAAASGDLFCFCDADDVVAPDWLRHIVSAAEDHHIVGGRVDLDRLNTDEVRTWRPPPAPVGSTPIPFAPTSNMAVWAECFHALGGLDEAFLKSHDVEFGKRAVAAGADLAHCPEAVVHYRLRSTLRGLAKQSYRAGRATVQMATAFPEREPAVGGRDVTRRLVWSITRLPYLAITGRRGTWVRRTADGAGMGVALLRRRFAPPEARS